MKSNPKSSKIEELMGCKLPASNGPLRLKQMVKFLRTKNQRSSHYDFFRGFNEYVNKVEHLQYNLSYDKTCSKLNHSTKSNSSSSTIIEKHLSHNNSNFSNYNDNIKHYSSHNKNVKIKSINNKVSNKQALSTNSWKPYYLGFPISNSDKNTSSQQIKSKIINSKPISKSKSVNKSKKSAKLSITVDPSINILNNSTTKQKSKRKTSKMCKEYVNNINNNLNSDLKADGNIININNKSLTNNTTSYNPNLSYENLKNQSDFSIRNCNNFTFNDSLSRNDYMDLYLNNQGHSDSNKPVMSNEKLLNTLNSISQDNNFIQINHGRYSDQSVSWNLTDENFSTLETLHTGLTPRPSLENCNSNVNLSDIHLIAENHSNIDDKDYTIKSSMQNCYVEDQEELDGEVACNKLMTSVLIEDNQNLKDKKISCIFDNQLRYRFIYQHTNKWKKSKSKKSLFCPIVVNSKENLLARKSSDLLFDKDKLEAVLQFSEKLAEKLKYKNDLEEWYSDSSSELIN